MSLARGLSVLFIQRISSHCYWPFLWLLKSLFYSFLLWSLWCLSFYWLWAFFGSFSSWQILEFPSFYRLNDVPLCVGGVYDRYIHTHTIFSLSIHHGHLDFFHILAMVNTAAINIEKQIHVQNPNFNSRNGITQSYGILFLSFWGTSILFL